jgi:hypothetical protein
MITQYDAVAARPEEVRMRLQPVFVFAGAMLMAAQGIADAAQRGDRIDALRQIATDVGRVVSTASVCREMSWPRIKTLTDKFSDLVKASVASGEEFSSIQQAYDQSTTEGQLSVSSKQTDCAAAVRQLADLEHAIASQPPAAADPGASPEHARTATAASPPPARATTGAAPPPEARRRDR